MLGVIKVFESNPTNTAYLFYLNPGGGDVGRYGDAARAVFAGSGEYAAGAAWPDHSAGSITADMEPRDRSMRQSAP